MKNGQKVILNIGTHGDERIGLKVARAIKKIDIKIGRLTVNIANPRAFKLNKRFIDEDLNRAFPGKKNGNYEEQRAYKLLPLIKSADIVIDIHSTTSELRDALIVTKLNNKIKEYVYIISPKYLLVMNATKKTVLISHAKIGLAFEYGKDNDPKVAEKIIDGIKSLLVHIGMIEKLKKNETKIKPSFFDVYKSVPKPKGAILDKKIKNYTLVKKNQIYAFIKNKKIKAAEDFYPILFGNKNYKNIFGFAGKKLFVSNTSIM